MDPARVTCIVLLRHGATAANACGRFQGWGDAGLSRAGRAAAREAVRRLGEMLGPDRIAGVVTSDLRRARETALLLPVGHFETERRLREMDFGTFESRTHTELLEDGGASYAAWLEDPDGSPPPRGETRAALRARVLAWWNEWWAQPSVRGETAGAGSPSGSDGAFVVVSHGGPMGVLLDHLLPADDPARERVPRPAGYILLLREPGRPGCWRVAAGHRLPSR